MGMLSDGQAAAMEEWVKAASDWSGAAQRLVGTASELSTASRSLAAAVDGGSNGLGASLNVLADEVEAETAGLRDRYLQTAANLDQYGEILGGTEEEEDQA